MFFTTSLCFVLSEIIQIQNWRTNKIKGITYPKSYKTEIKILANPGLALWDFKKPVQSFVW